MNHPDAWWIPAAFLVPAFIICAAVALIEEAGDLWSDHED